MGLFRKSMTRERFAAEALEVVRRFPGIGDPVLDQEAFAIRLGGDHAGWLYLDTVFRETATASRAERAGRIQRLLAGLTEDRHPTDWSAVKPLLRPVLRGAAFGLHPSSSTQGLCRPAMPYLGEFVVIDRPTSMAYVTASQVADWGIEPAEVFATARANIASAAAAVVLGSDDSGTANQPRMLRFVDDGDAYFASYLLVDGFLAGMAEHVGGRPIAYVPDVNTLVIAPEPLHARLAEIMYNQYEQAPRSLSPVAYTVDDRGAVQPYYVGELGEVHDKVHQAQLRLAVDEYGQQTAALRAQFEQSDTDIFVGELMVVEPPSGSSFSLCVWPAECDSLLPEAEFVGFQTSSGPVRVPWPVVRAQAGLVAAAGYTPPRFRVTDTPPEPVMSRILADSIAF